MMNYWDKNLRQILTKLRKEGIRVEGQIRKSKYGRFCWVIDPEGNPIELWEPPKKYNGPEEEISSQ
jgi:predicted enzyme related to lactoylglutathione lyase